MPSAPITIAQKPCTLVDRIDRRLLTQPLIPGTLALASTAIADAKSEGGPLFIASFSLLACRKVIVKPSVPFRGATSTL